jgi:5-hydroxyisourate hydrolase
MSAITTHVLDTSRGRPAKGVRIVLEFESDKDEWTILGKGETDNDGRLRTLLATEENKLQEGTYRLTFDVGDYFASQDVGSFYPSVSITFTVRDITEHYHVPLLLSPFGFSTYRGS